MLLPFENFVIKPNKWIGEILTFLDQTEDQKFKKSVKNTKRTKKSSNTRI